jgi:hypothetical protein
MWLDTRLEFSYPQPNRTHPMKHLALLLASLTLSLGSTPAAVSSGDASSILKNPVKADPVLKSIGTLKFGPAGILLIAEPSAASIVALDTGDTAPLTKLANPVEDTATLAASALNTTGDQIQIVDMAANPFSGKVYLSVRNNSAKNVAIVVIDSAGKAKALDLASRPHVKVALPKNEAGPIRNISDLAFTPDRLLVTGQSNEEFSSKIFSIALPLGAVSTGGVYSAETYHVSHRKWETKAPIQSFIPFDDHGTLCVLGAFACTPIAKFPLKDITAGANIRGTSVVELGSGNRPLDLFSYANAKGAWIVCNTLRFHKPLFGSSKYWGVRVSLDLLNENSPAKTNENAVRRDVKSAKGPEGIEILESLSGATQVSKLSDSEMVALRETDDKLRLEIVALP